MNSNSFIKGSISIYLIFSLVTISFISMMVFEGVTDKPGAGAIVLIVDPSGGGDHTSISEAVSSALTGYTIMVYAGTYVENVIIDKPLTIIGNGTSNTTINGGIFGDTVQITSDWVNMSGFKIVSSGWSLLDAGINISGASNCILTSINLTNNKNGIYIRNQAQNNEFYYINSSHNYKFQLMINSSNNNKFISCIFNGSDTRGLNLTDSNGTQIKSSEIYTPPVNNSINLTRSDITVLDTLFDNNTVNYHDQTSKLYLQNYLTVVVEEPVSLPVSGATVNVKDQFSFPVNITVTGPSGIVTFPVTYYIGQDKNSDGDDLDASERNILSPHNVTVNKTDYITGYATPQPVMQTNVNITVTIEPITVDYIIIQDGPGPSGVNVSGSHYSLGGTDIFYASGYSNKVGYVQEVSAVWSSSNTSIANVNSPGTSTTFTASITNYGLVNIFASLSGITTYVTVTVDQGTIDYIIIQDSPLGTGSWIDNRAYSVGENSTFYCGGYNNTGGFVGVVSANWISSNPEVGTVSSSGTQTLFNASTNKSGTTKVTATYLTFTNVTGTLTVLTPTIDHITIVSAPNGTGSWVDKRSYYIDGMDTFYCAGGNKTSGYIQDLNVTWYSSQPVYATVTSSGNFTTFTAVAAGKVKVNAIYNSLTNSTGWLWILGHPAPPDIDLTVWETIQPAEPVMENTTIDITATIENLGTVTANNTLVHLYEVESGKANLTLLSTFLTPFLAGKQTVTAVFSSLSFWAGKHRLYIMVDPNDEIYETVETNNVANTTLDAQGMLDWIIEIRVIPSNMTITADDTLQFNATGIGRDSVNYTIVPTWSTNGGGSIDANGLFTAYIVGTWEVRAKFGSVSSNVTVIIVPGNVTLIRIMNATDMLDLGDTFQFEITGHDSKNNDAQLAPDDVEWYVLGGIGNITSTGFFTATNPGSGRVGARIFSNDEWVTYEVPIIIKTTVIIEEEYEVPTETNASFKINVAFVNKTGNVTYKALVVADLIVENIGEETFGEKLKHIGVFIKIEIPEDVDWDWIIIECQYNPHDLPEGITEDDLVMFYFSETNGTWVKCNNSWVDKKVNTIYANVTHLTIFAPMAESSGEAGGPPDEEDGEGEEETGDVGAGISIFMILALVAVVFIIAMAAGVIIIRRRRTVLEPGTEEAEEEAESEEGGPEDEAEEREMVEHELVEERPKEVPLDDHELLDELEMETKTCPQCETVIEVEPSLDKKIFVECPECGLKGKLTNPYLKDIEQLRMEKEKERRMREKEERKRREMEERERKRIEMEEREKMERKGIVEDIAPEPIKIPCPECGTVQTAPFSKTAKKIALECDECGTFMSIKNPYLKDTGVEADKALIKWKESEGKKVKPIKMRGIMIDKEVDEEELDFDLTKDDESEEEDEEEYEEEYEEEEEGEAVDDKHKIDWS
ncbi:MAG: hypothetical protein JSV49_06920 [Thermoplasmata archaeon]|nr:MAG: hypothetical protein JSV49_06920 [Thermoplasmata archaeon]